MENLSKEIGHITSVKFGFGGYDDIQFGISYTFEFGGCSNVADFKGFWATERTERHKWTEADRKSAYGDMVVELVAVMRAANVKDVMDLVGIPVEVTLDGNVLHSWRVLHEAVRGGVAPKVQP